MHKRTTWVTTRRLKRPWITVIVFLLIILLLGLVLWRIFLATTANRLLENPLPRPEYIISVGPVGETTGGDSICAEIDLRVLTPAIGAPEHNYQFALDKLNLYLNGQPIDDKSEVIYAAVPSLGNTVVDYCGKAELVPGVNLAELTIQSTSSGTLSYQWAFKMNKH